MAQITDALISYAVLAVIVIGPFIAFAAVIHFLERTIQKRLAERFGWASVMWTGWLGTPIHELSHAAMCVLFRHRIDEISLFEPDTNTGRLGFVRHSWRKGNWFEELGNAFIGIAPLVGGSVVLLVLLWMFYPGVFQFPAETELESPKDPFAFFQNIVTVLFQLESIFSLRFWVFVYLVLCVASHMAPSRSDYEGAWKGGIMCMIGLATLIFVLSVAVPDVSTIQANALRILAPLFALLSVAVFLCGMATLIVSVAVSYFPQRYRVE